MTQQVVHARVILPNAQTLQDQASFGLTFEATGSNTSLDINSATVGVRDTLEFFLNGKQSGQTNTVAGYISAAISRAANACSIEWYDVTGHLDGSNAGSPFQIDHFTLGNPAAAEQGPAALSLCIGYRAAYGTDIERGGTASLPSTDAAIDQGAPATHTGTIRPRARDRGRFYLGPLIHSAVDPTTGAPSSVCKTDVGIAAADMLALQESGLAAQWNAVVWSRRGATVKAVSYYYVDEGFAIVRKRGDTTESRVHTWNSV